jgi:diguanylate cyclase (GGDEF)-like protein/putative nucleotidyltransferase with HDIG domain
MRPRAQLFIVVTAMLGAGLLISSFHSWHAVDYWRFSAYLVFAILASGLTVVLPGLNTSQSGNFLFTLLAILELSLPETMIMACVPTLVQCFWKMNRPAKPIRLLFNVVCMMAPATWLSWWTYQLSGRLLGHSAPLMTMTAACVFFLANTLPIAGIISLTEDRPFGRTWVDGYYWSFPYYLAGAGLVVVVHYVNRYIGWQTSLLVMPVVYWVYRSYRLYLGRLENEKDHVEDLASLHLRTIEALALAIEAKDHTTHDHLQRVRVYATEIAKELGLPEAETEALKAAALLHDIGKLAVPEHIISKPGRLTPEEFDKMKIHPIVGAEILARVKFPYPVVPIVRGHHEKWNGSGYPDGLAGENIPIGARILAVVDCLDALASDRQYRRALPLDEAMKYVADLAGKDYDPRIIEILRRRYVELEHMARTQQPSQHFTLGPTVTAETATAPSAGYEPKAEIPPAAEPDFLSSIAAARQEGQMLFELTHDLGATLSLEDTLSVVSARLRKLVPYDTIAVWVCEQDVLKPRHVSGDDFRLFSSLEIPLGQGLSGWVAQNAKPLLNANPSLESAHLSNPIKSSSLRSALAVPLEGLNGTIGAMTLYRTEANAFEPDHLRILLAISSKVALSIENAMKFQQVQCTATTDYLTGLPNARSLFLHLDREIARCTRTGIGLAVMVCDLDKFKEINDLHGHLEGNKALRLFAAALQENCREYDYVARMGGDEFVVVVPGLSAEVVAAKAERINEMAKLAGLQISSDSRLSASIGTAFFPEDGANVEQILAEADRRMYMCKHSYGEHHGAEGPMGQTGHARPQADFES